MRTGRRVPSRTARRAVLAAALAVAAGALPLDSGSTAGDAPTTGRGVELPRRPAPSRLPDQANVVLITADDMRPDDLKAMPFTRTFLARRGVTFTDSLSPNNLCCPARAEIVTGQYGHNSGVMGNKWPNGGYYSMKRPNNTLPVWLQDAGYRTGFVGKYINGYGNPPPGDLASQGRSGNEVPPGWNRWWGAVENIYEYTRVTLLRRVPGLPKRRVAFDKYQSVLYARIATRMIRTFHENTDDPFFIWMSSATPHTRVEAPNGLPVAQPKYDDLYRGAVPQDRFWEARFNEPTVDKAGEMHDRAPVDRAKVLRLHRHRLRSLRSLDDSVKSVVTELKSTDELQDTVVIFTGDNGYALGEHRATGKNLPYEAMLAVPMIVAAPGLRERYRPSSEPGDIVRSALTVTTLDIPATIVAVADAPTPWAVEGVNMMRPRANPDFGDGVRGVVFESGTEAARRTDVRRFVGVRTDRWTYFGWDGAVRLRNGVRALYFNVRNRFDAEQGWRELYDRRRHPLQNFNRWGLHPAVTEELRRMANVRHDCRGRACVFAATTQ